MLKRIMNRRHILTTGITAAALSAASGAQAADSDASGLSEIARLTAVEEIKLLRARYFRFVDTSKFGELKTLFTPDATLFFPEHDERPKSIDVSIAAFEELLKGAISIHQGYMPEIEILSPTTARGITAMTDHLYLPAQNILGVSEVIGAGHYHETYERREGRWLIRTLKLTRLRFYTVSLPKPVE